MGNTWTETELKPPVGLSNGVGGVGVSGDTVLSGDPGCVPCAPVGGVHVYLLHQPLATYCVGKPNSEGCSPSISFQGCPSASATSGFRIRATNVRDKRHGMLLYSASGRAAIPFLGGTLCAATPVQRTPAVYSNTGVPAWYTCAGMFEIDMAAFAHGLLGGSPSPLLTTVGTVIDCQWWGRDKGSNPAFAATFSDALEYTVIP